MQPDATEVARRLQREKGHLGSPHLVRRKEAAAALGVTRQRVEALIKRWPDVEGPNGIDIARLKTLREQYADPLRQAVYRQQRTLKAQAGPDAPKTVGKPKTATAAQGDNEQALPLEALDFNGARTRRERANARLAEMKAAHEAGRLIERDEVHKKEFKIARMIRDRLLGLPARLAHAVSAEALRVVEEVCNETIDAMQSEVARFISTHPFESATGGKDDT